MTPTIALEADDELERDDDDVRDSAAGSSSDGAAGIRCCGVLVLLVLVGVTSIVSAVWIALALWP